MENDAKVSKDQWANNQLPLLSRVYIGDVLRDIVGVIMPNSLTLAIRNVPISVALPKVAKASTIVTVACCCCWHYCLKYIANLHRPLPTDVLPHLALIVCLYYCFLSEYFVHLKKYSTHTTVIYHIICIFKG